MDSGVSNFVTRARFEKAVRAMLLRRRGVERRAVAVATNEYKIDARMRASSSQRQIATECEAPDLDLHFKMAVLLTDRIRSLRHLLESGPRKEIDRGSPERLTP